MDTLKYFAKSVVAHIFVKQIIYSESPDHVPPPTFILLNCALCFKTTSL